MPAAQAPQGSSVRQTGPVASFLYMDVRTLPALLPSLAVVSGAVLGLRLVFLPVPLAALLAAAGVAFGGRGGLVTAAFAAGLLSAAVAGGEPALAAVEPRRPVVVAGTVAGHWTWDGDVWSAPLRLRRLVQRRRVLLGRGEEVRLTLPGPQPPPPFGSRLRLRGHLRRSAGFANAVPVEPGPWRMRLESRRLLEMEAPPGAVARLAAALRARVERGMRSAVQLAAEPIGERGEGAGGSRRGTSAMAAGSPPPLDPARLSPGPALVRALVLGDAGAVPERWRRGLRRTGLAHVLAVSGLHVGLVAAAALLVAAPLGVRPRLVLALAAVALYLLVAGPRPALLRASWMALLAAAALLLGRRPLAGNALAVTAAALVLARPALVDDLGFRLTAAATAGLVFLAPRLAVVVRAGSAAAGMAAGRGLTLVSRPLRGLGALGTGMAASVAAQVASAPFALPAFHLVSATSPLTNLAAVPWTAFVLAAGMAWTGLAVAVPEWAAAWVPWLDAAAAPFGWPATGGPDAWGVVAAVAPAWVCGVWVAAVGVAVGPWGARRGGGGGDGGVGGVTGPAGPMMERGAGDGEGEEEKRLETGAWADVASPGGVRRPALRTSHRQWCGAFLSFLPLLSLLILTFTLWPAFKWGSVQGRRPAGIELTMLDVGQGDAILLRDGPTAILVDGGGWRRGDLGGRVLVPALLGEGVGRLAAVVVTHADRDHCRGLVDVASYLPIGEVWVADGFQTEPCVDELAAAALAGRPWALRLLGSGAGPGSPPAPGVAAEMAVGRWRLRVLHPQGAGPPSRRLAAARRGNDHSLVLAAEALGRRALLTGDVEAAAERALLRRWTGEQERLRAEVLKVAHHGSKSSSGEGFLDAVAPRLGLVPVGADNPYHHPSPAIVARFARRGVPLLRSDRHGFVRLGWRGPRGWRWTTGR
jgi:competence protein ComEC